MLYRVTYTDGSQELIEADDVGAAREEAQQLYDAARVRRVVAVEDEEEPDGGDSDGNPTEEEDEEDEE